MIYIINIVAQHQYDGDLDVIKTMIDSNTTQCRCLEFCELLDSILDGNKKYEEAICYNDLEFIQQHIEQIQKVKSIVLELNKKIHGYSYQKIK